MQRNGRAERQTFVNSLDDAQTVRDGQDAFESFYREHQVRAVRLAHLLTGSNGIAQEVAQEAFLAVHRNWAALDTPAAFLRTAVVNSSRSVQRRQIRERRFVHREAAHLTHVPEMDETWQLIRTLRPAQRVAIVLRFYEDLSVAEIAAVVGTPVGTVKSQISRGLASLKARVR